MQERQNKNRTILLVDDEAALLEMLCGVFARAGYTKLLTAATGAAAVAGDTA